MSTPTVTSTVLRAATRQAAVTMRRKYTSVAGIVSSLSVPVIFSAILWFNRDGQLQDQVQMTAFLLCGFLAFGAIAGAVLGVASETQTEREDGTLLRAKSVPHGMLGHLIAKLMIAPVDALIPVLPMLLFAAVAIPSALPTGIGGWLALILVYLLAVAAMLPWGAVLGSVFRSMLGFGFAMMAIYALAVVSGLFFPITILPAWLQTIVQISPVYWIGRGLRAVFLPPEASALEVGGEWGLGLTVLILAVWTVAGLILAPVVLRRMARKQSGSIVTAARDRALARGY